MTPISSERNFAMPPADKDKAETYRKQAIQMFGSAEMPVVLYKGVTYGKRSI